ncbi:GNAT family N-acetyltransferase [Roseovarius spongiae]|uniref:GNAT family N-acetyltransferase n=1 Tax=Roseovarius spongiae TaxID=2320272 RepID=A0A3A8AX16_9RHOB|nr:GNAT family N-acetyltransferase [Roseovarius spongiae]RKF14234.1 GNAT family N-acetyltransferase [Roseovarius spongiae]
MARLHARAFAGQGRGWREAEFAELIASDAVTWAGDARAFGLSRLIADEAELLTLATDPDHRRQGLARQVLGRLEASLRARRAARHVLEVAEDNGGARALYAAAGYAIVARRAGYYFRGARRVDALVLAKTLTGPGAA